MASGQNGHADAWLGEACQNSAIFKIRARLTESTRISECLVADVAYERLLVAVDEHVLGKSLFGRKTLVACRADMRLVYGLLLAGTATEQKSCMQLTANMCLHVSLDLASLRKPCGTGVAPWTVVPAATEPLGTFLRMLDVGF